MSTENVEQGGDLTSLLLQASQMSIILQKENRKLAVENAMLRQKVAELEGMPCLRPSVGCTGQLTKFRPSIRRSISNFPAEILRMIFSALIPLEDSLHCETLTWVKAFNAKYTVARVCRSWYKSCFDRLYEHVHLSRLPQLPRLVRTLESSGTKELARSILRVDLNFFVPKGWEMLYHHDLRRFLSLCPSILVLDHTIYFDAKSQLDPAIYVTLAVFLENVTCLSLGRDEMSFESQCRLISGLTTLRELEFHPGTLEDCPEDQTQKFTATLPHLFSLTILLRNGTCRTIRYLTLWTIPSVRRLSVSITPQHGEWEPLQVIQLLPGLCSTHGANLSFFSLDLSTVRVLHPHIPRAPILTKLLTCFPKIEHLALYPASEEILHYPVMPFLQQFDFAGSGYEGFKQHMEFIADSRDLLFPKLRVVRILNPCFSGPPTYWPLEKPLQDIFRNFIEAARPLGMELQNYRGNTLEINRRYHLLCGGDGEKTIQYEIDFDFEEESDDTYEYQTSEDDESGSQSGDSLSCLSDRSEESQPEPDMDHDTLLRLWDQMRQTEGEEGMSCSSEST
ncbi:hypothetical protein BD410DRAFT_793753 [Rickenella mellea]|uniref:F-box domain-containing protein n=1 Tax=Rickenella mellea TaxID=50990 RepID=A0A4Y7PU17_9AGAM|nr:hypothetical protein BD410DRAFT_793753 [Rickenella mellea]